MHLKHALEYAVKKYKKSIAQVTVRAAILATVSGAKLRQP